MKIYIDIDQKASLIAGLEAPSSSTVIDVNIADIPAETRETLVPCYDMPTGRFYGYKLPGISHTFSDNINDGVPRLLANATPSDVVTALNATAEKVRAEQSRMAAEENEELAKYVAILKECKTAACAPMVAAPIYVRHDGTMWRWQHTPQSGCDELSGFAKPMPDDHIPSGALREERDAILSAVKNEVEAANRAIIEANLPAIETAKLEREAAAKIKAKEAEAEKQAKIAARAAARLESGKFAKSFGSYNERRYSAWWVATVDLSGKKAEYIFNGYSDAKHGNAGDIEIDCKPGDCIAYGQEDLRKPANNENNIYVMDVDGRMISCDGIIDARATQKAVRAKLADIVTA